MQLQKGAGVHTQVLASGTALLPAAAPPVPLGCPSDHLICWARPLLVPTFLTHLLTTRRKFSEPLPHSVLGCHSQNVEENPNDCTVLISQRTLCTWGCQRSRLPPVSTWIALTTPICQWETLLLSEVIQTHEFPILFSNSRKRVNNQNGVHLDNILKWQPGNSSKHSSTSHKRKSIEMGWPHTHRGETVQSADTVGPVNGHEGTLNSRKS